MVLDSYLTVLFATMGVLFLLFVAGRALWPTAGRRVWRHFAAWWERDARAEREAKLLQTARVRAEAEIRESLDETEDSRPTLTESLENRTAVEMNATKIALRYDPNAKYENADSAMPTPTMAEIDRSEGARRIRPRLSEESRKILRN